MNRLTVTIVVDTYSHNPEEWIGDLVADSLEPDEQLVSISSTTTPDN